MRKAIKYITANGDMWDSIALEFYGDEKFAPILIQMNFKYSNVLVFDDNVEIIIPQLSEEILNKTTLKLPPWRV